MLLHNLIYKIVLFIIFIKKKKPNKQTKKKSDKMFLCLLQMTNVSLLDWVTGASHPEKATHLHQTNIDHSSAVQQNWSGQQKFLK